MKTKTKLAGIATALSFAAVVAYAGAGLEIETQGDVIAVSAEERRLTLEETAPPSAESAPDAMQSGVIRDFLVNDETRVTDGGEAIDLADVGVGSHAAIRYVLEDGRNVALSIEVRSPATD